MIKMIIFILKRIRLIIHDLMTFYGNFKTLICQEYDVLNHKKILFYFPFKMHLLS